MVYMFEISTASATAVRFLFGGSAYSGRGGAYLIFGVTVAALIRERHLFR